jgi:hypothetical protein
MRFSRAIAALWSAWHTAHNEYRRVMRGHPPIYQPNSKPTPIDYKDEAAWLRSKQQ